MIRESSLKESRSHRQMIVGALATTLITAAPAAAFMQQTKLEGTLGTDIGGVWLSVQQIMPEFRITYPKPGQGPAVPVAVGPIPADLEPITGKDAQGIVITSCDDAAFCNENGIMVGDIVIQVNSQVVKDVASFKAAIENPPPTVMLSIRRPAIRMSTTRLMKIRFKSQAKEEGGTSTTGAEELDIQVLDVALPFASAVEDTRNTHAFFQPTEAQLTQLKAKWPELRPNEPQRLMTAKHRLVAKAAFDASLESDTSLTRAKAALIMDMEGAPGRGGGGKVIDVYAIETMDEKEISGGYVSVTMANAPFPINIEFKGRFRMIKVAEWTEKDAKLQAERDSTKRVEDLNKYKTLPDVPAAEGDKH